MNRSRTSFALAGDRVLEELKSDLSRLVRIAHPNYDSPQSGQEYNVQSAQGTSLLSVLRQT